MEHLVCAKHLVKKFGHQLALDDVSFNIPAGRIVGLIGPNGAGKTTLLKSILGLAPVDGQLHVMGMNPHQNREKLLQQVSFIADTAILPRWLKVREAIAYVEGVHEGFSRSKCLHFLSKTNIGLNTPVKALSKGMVTQLHLALIMAINSRLLVLDEPTLGLDIIYRKQFYQSLLTDYFDEQKTIIITTHQVEEIENVLTDLLFINKGKIVLDASMDTLAEQFIELQVDAEGLARALVHNPIHVSARLGGYALIFENTPAHALAGLGKQVTPSLADIFVAKIQPNTAPKG